MKKIIETYGYERARSDRLFRREREAWTSAAWALGLAENDQRQYWVEIETIDNTPDTRVHWMDQSSGNNVINTYSLEITDWEEHVDDLMQIIRQKCEKAYPPNYVLVILGRSGRTVEPGEIVKEIRELPRVPFAEIWLLGRASSDRNTQRMVRLRPEGADVSFDLNRAVARTASQREFARLDGRGTGIEPCSSGDIYLPIP
jgi:hypothetical protein